MLKKEGIRVYVRIRPNSDEDNEGITTITSGQLVVHDHIPVSFSFPTRIVSGSNQVHAFNSIAADLMENLRNGYSCTLLAYGQTGSGKTFTMFGPPGCLTESELHATPGNGTPSTWGIFPRLAMDLLHMDCVLNATAIEVYQDSAYDLLDNGKRISIGRAREEVVVTGGSVSGVIRGRGGVHDAKCRCGKCRIAQKKVSNERLAKIREQQSERVTRSKPMPSTQPRVKEETYATVGETVASLTSSEDIARLSRTVELSRTAHGHLLNARSSRSHCVVRVFIKQRHKCTNAIRKQQFCFVDLAGSERIHKSGVSGARMSEALEINQSLSVLGRVILQLGKNDVHIPYRDSTLTMLLKSSFDGHSTTAVVINISDSPVHVKETISSLRFGERMRSVHPKVAPGELLSVEENQRSIKILQEELASKKASLKLLEAAGKGGTFGCNVVTSEKATFLANLKAQAAMKLKLDKLKIQIAEVKASGNVGNLKLSQLMAEHSSISSRYSNLRDVILRQKTIPNFWVPPTAQYLALEAEVSTIEGRLRTSAV